MSNSRALPPYAATIGIAIAEPGDPDAANPAPILALPFSADVEGRPRLLHGGAIAGLLEMAAHMAVNATLAARDEAVSYKPIGITIDYMRGGTAQLTLARGRVTRVGSRVATVIVEAWQGDAKRDDERRVIALARLHVLLNREPVSD